MLRIFGWKKGLFSRYGSWLVGCLISIEYQLNAKMVDPLPRPPPVPLTQDRSHLRLRLAHGYQGISIKRPPRNPHPLNSDSQIGELKSAPPQFGRLVWRAKIRTPPSPLRDPPQTEICCDFRALERVFTLQNERRRRFFVILERYRGILPCKMCAAGDFL